MTAPPLSSLLLSTAPLPLLSTAHPSPAHPSPAHNPLPLRLLPTGRRSLRQINLPLYGSASATTSAASAVSATQGTSAAASALALANAVANGNANALALAFTAANAGGTGGVSRKQTALTPQTALTVLHSANAGRSTLTGMLLLASHVHALLSPLCCPWLLHLQAGSQAVAQAVALAYTLVSRPIHVGHAAHLSSLAYHQRRLSGY